MNINNGHYKNSRFKRDFGILEWWFTFDAIRHVARLGYPMSFFFYGGLDLMIIQLSEHKLLGHAWDMLKYSPMWDIYEHGIKVGMHDERACAASDC